MKKFFRQHSEKITAFFLAAVFIFGFSVSVLTHPAFAADLGSYSDYNASNWEDVSEDAQELARAYLEVLKSTSIGNYFDEVTDIPISWLKLASDGSYALSPFSGVYYFLNSIGELEVENTTSSSHGGRHRVGTENDDVVVDSDTFKQCLDSTELVYYPVGATSKVSWKKDKYFSNSNFDAKRSAYYFTILDKRNFFGIDGLKKFYAVPFYENGDDLYFSNYCIYFNLDTQQINSSGDVTIHAFDISYVDVLNTTVDLRNTEDYKAIFDENVYSLAEESYIVNRINTCLYAAWYYHGVGTAIALQNRDDFLSSPGLANANGGCTIFKGFSPFNRLYNSKNSTLSVTSSFFNYPNFTSGPLSEKTEDFGFYISDTPILMDCFGADIDTTKIPDNYYITVSGDTIYDYSITNPETGQSSTVNEYMTNNYTYITNNPGGDSSGTSGGNVTVGGNVGVNGNVNVGGEVKFGGEVSVGVEVSPIDINVNVSGNAGSSGAGESAPDPELPDTSIFNGYLNDALDESTGIRKFISDFFGGLPGEITTLVCIGLVLVILCRLFGR